MVITLTSRFALNRLAIVVLALFGAGLCGCEKDRARQAVTIPPDLVSSNSDGSTHTKDESSPSVGTSDAKPQRILDVTFNDVKFEIEKGGKFERSMLPDQISQMEGRQLRIRGYMLASIHTHGLSRFILLQNATCPFGGPEAYLYHNIQVELDTGITTSFTTKAIAIEGVFSIRPFLGLEGEHLSIYHIQGKKVY
jgi:hypothetical protein